MKFFSISSSSTISSALRRIFCFKTSLPTPNQLHENITDFRNYTDEKIGPNPGIVARLMGLDSIPLMDLTNIAIEKAANSISKEDISKSLEENLVSYPVFLLKHEVDYIVISFEEGKKENRSKATRRRKRSLDGKFEEIQPNTEEEKGKENQDPHKDGKFKEFCECYSKFLTGKGRIFSEKSNCEKHWNGREQSKALYCSKHKEVKEQQSDTENDSPSSVLDIDSFYTDPGVVAKSGLFELKSSSFLVVSRGPHEATKIYNFVADSKYIWTI